MPARHARLRADAGALAASLAAFRASLDLPGEFPSGAVDEIGEEAVDGSDASRADLTGVAFHTIDPEGSRDLDQALSIGRSGDGFLVRYAIADLAACVRPGGALDAEVRRRGQTLYAPDGSVPLHPLELSHGAASLLPRERRRAYAWRFALDAAGAVAEVGLERAWVRSRRQWTYAEAQREIDAGTAPPEIVLLAEVGPLRVAQEAARGGASLDTPEEEIVEVDGGYRLTRRAPLPVEDWNAQDSLMTGMAAADLMLRAGVGILRTMPPAAEEALAGFRATTRTLGRPWGDDVDYGAYLRSLDAGDPVTAAIMQAATKLFRGAGYEPFDGSPPADPEQAAIAAPYAHATAPLRRLVDRFVLAICEAEANGADIPAWARGALGELPAVMQRSGQLAGRLESGAIDRIEAAVLAGMTGAELTAVVIAETKDGVRVQVTDPFVSTTVPGPAAVGSEVRVRVDATDIAAGTVTLSIVG